MRKITIIELAIIISTLVIIFPLMLSMNGMSVSVYDQAVTQFDRRTITFDLKSGQNVTGWLDFTGDTNGAWFQLYDPNENLPKIGDITHDGSHVSFTFTADINGQYYIRVGVLGLSTEYINRQYSITSSPILGFDPAVLTVIVITVGVVLALTIAIWDLR
ncbi:PPC domain-containing protein [Candidatus Bathyarchaeota archaeon]|nr:PPC domain-containing protein [Candidatus Bathyarchaeota archaeon]